MYGKKRIWGRPLAALGLSIIGIQAYASCGSANCTLVTGTQESIPGPGQGTIDLSYRYIPMDNARHGGDSADEALVPGIDFASGAIEPAHHRELRTTNELVQLDINYGLTPHWTMALSLPLINNRRHEHVVIHHAAEEFTNQDGSSGFGDVRVDFKYAVAQSLKQLFTAGIGVKMPTGEYRLRNSDGVINEPTIMPGTGSWDGLISAFYSYQVRPHQFSLFASGSYQLNTENSLNYRFGDTLLADAGFNYRIGPKLVSSLQLNLRSSDRDEFIGTEVPSTGGTWVYLTPGITMQTAESASLYAHLQLPVYQYVNGSNLVPGFGLIIGASYNFQ